MTGQMAGQMLDLADKKIIVLTGMMGAGKTTIGSKLAEKLGFYK